MRDQQGIKALCYVAPLSQVEVGQGEGELWGRRHLGIWVGWGLGQVRERRTSLTRPARCSFQSPFQREVRLVRERILSELCREGSRKNLEELDTVIALRG